jgi:hypothetical protein
MACLKTTIFLLALALNKLVCDYASTPSPGTGLCHYLSHHAPFIQYNEYKYRNALSIATKQYHRYKPPVQSFLVLIHRRHILTRSPSWNILVILSKLLVISCRCPHNLYLFIHLSDYFTYQATMSSNGSLGDGDFLLVVEFKDHIRKFVREQPGWCEVYPGESQRRNEMQGWARLRDKEDATAAYSTYTL